MTQQTFQIQFGESLDGRNAKNFWGGVIVIAVATYLWWHGWFSISLFESGLVDPPEGYAATLTTLLLDTVAWLGVTALAVFRFCKPFLIGLVERIGFVAIGLFSWSAERQDRTTTNEALKQQIRIHHETIANLEREVAKLKSAATEASDEVGA